MGSQTYSTDEDLVLDNGKSIDILFDTGITSIERLKMKQLARERAFNFINDRYLRGKTAVPAHHIYAVREIEKDLVIANLLNGAFTMESANTSVWSK